MKKNYHVLDMYKKHQDARQIRATVHCDSLKREGCDALESLGASPAEKDGSILITMANLYADSPMEVKLSYADQPKESPADITSLAHSSLHAFENPHAVMPAYEQRLCAAGTA